MKNDEKRLQDTKKRTNTHWAQFNKADASTRNEDVLCKVIFFVEEKINSTIIDL